MASAPASGAAYLTKHGVENAIQRALAEVIRAQPDDPVGALGERLIALASPAAGENPLDDEELRKKEKPIATQERAVELARDLFGLTVYADSVKDLDSYDDRNFYFAAQASRPELTDHKDSHAHEKLPGHFHYVLKVHNGVESLSVGFIECQNQAMETVRAAGVWCPRALPADNGAAIAFAEQPLGDGTTIRRHAVRCLPFRPSQLLGSVVATRDLLGELGAVTARVTVALSTFDHPSAHRVFVWDLAQALAVRPLVQHLSHERQQVINGVLDEFEGRVLPLRHKLRSCVIHGDINDQNVLVAAAGEDGEDGQLEVAGIIDFGDMCFTWRINEIAIAIAYAVIALHYDKGSAASAGGGGSAASRDELSEADACAAMAGRYASELDRSGEALTEDEWRVLPTLIAVRIAVSLSIGAYSSAKDPTNEYLKLTLLPGLTALQRLRAIPADDLEQSLRAAVRKSS